MSKIIREVGEAAILTLILGILLAGRVGAQSCLGDCNGNGAVTAGELTKIVAVILNCGSVATGCVAVPGGCTACDKNGNGMISAGEYTNVISNVLTFPSGCPPGATATPTSTRSPATPTPTKTPTPMEAVCGDGTVQPPEECDRGGTCTGGDNAGTSCTAESQCVGQGICTEGIKIGTACDSSADCPGGQCIRCKTFGGAGCAANCTTETDIPYTLKSSTLLKQCLNGSNADQPCTSAAQCPGGTCVPQIRPGNSGAFVHDGIIQLGLTFSGSQTLTIGKLRDGKITGVIKAASVQLPKIPVSLLACACVRSVVAQTCGGTMFEKDGTFSTDCSEGFSTGPSACDGKKPCAYVHGPNNSSSALIGCDGLAGINLLAEQSSNGRSLLEYPPAPTPPAGSGPAIVTLSGSGGPGSAIVLNTTAIGTVTGSCENNPAAGTDKSMCTDDDPAAAKGMVQTLPQVTGTATAVLTNTKGSTQKPPNDMQIGPFSYTGVLYDCAKLSASPPTAEGANVVGAFTGLNQPGTGDIVVRNSFVIGPRQ